MAFVNTTIFASYMSKDCENMKGTLKIPNKVTTCTGDLYLFYECDGVLKAGCADTKMYISSHCPEVDCQSTIRNLIDNDYFNIRAVDDVILVDIKPFSWKRVLNFLYGFVNDTNDYVYIVMLFFLFGILIFFMRILLCKSTNVFMRSSSAIPSAPPMPFVPAVTYEPQMPNSYYDQNYVVYNENKSNKNTKKEIAPYTGTICRACQFKAKSSAGLNTHIKAMLKGKKSSKMIHSQYYK